MSKLLALLVGDWSIAESELLSEAVCGEGCSEGGDGGSEGGEVGEESCED